MISIPHKVSILTLSENTVMENGEIPNLDIWYKEIKMNNNEYIMIK